MAIAHPINTAGEFETREPDSPFVIRESYFVPRRNDLRVERDGLRMTFVDLHRPLQDYAVALERAGFVIEAIREIGDEEEPARRESQTRWRRLPLFLHIRGAKR